VYATPNLAATVAELRSRWGIELVEGGPHIGRGTRNYLAGLNNGTYLEIIGPDPDQPTPKAPRPFGVDNIDRARLVTWCARPSRPLDDVVRSTTKAGFDIGSVTAMSRRRPDGEILEWELTVRPGAPHPIVPFCIYWGTTAHPTISLNHTTWLAELVLTDAEPASFNRVLDAIGETIRVKQGARSISAVLTTPRGELVLASGDPDRSGSLEST
jgi:Glyoxalase-like domain